MTIKYFQTTVFQTYIVVLYLCYIIEKTILLFHSSVPFHHSISAFHSTDSRHSNLHDNLSNAQHGFCSKRSCETQLLLTVHDFASGLNDGKQMDAIILDFTKAFDKVSHKHLCTKLHYMVYVVQYLIGLKTSSQIGLNK